MMISPCIGIAVEYLESLRSGSNELVPECSRPLLYTFVLEFLSEKKSSNAFDDKQYNLMNMYRNEKAYRIYKICLRKIE